jgi:hypothetical protein
MGSIAALNARVDGIAESLKEVLEVVRNQQAVQQTERTNTMPTIVAPKKEKWKTMLTQVKEMFQEKYPDIYE